MMLTEDIKLMDSLKSHNQANSLTLSVHIC